MKSKERRISKHGAGSNDWMSAPEKSVKSNISNQKSVTYTRKAVSLGTILMILAVIVLAGISAYFTDTEAKTNVFTVGNVDITLTETNFDSTQTMEHIVPGQVIQKNPQIQNTGANPAYVYLKVTIPKESYTHNGNTVTGQELFTYTPSSSWTEMTSYKEDGTDSITKLYYYNTILPPTNGSNVTTALFDTVTVANFPNFDSLSSTTQNIVINAYAIQSQLTIPQGENAFIAAYETYLDQEDTTAPRLSVVNSQTGEYETIRLTRSNAADYYGRAVNYGETGTASANLTWRIFYVDFDNKYGDGAGTIYLKADYDESIATNLNSYASYTNQTKVKEMNPAWANGATSASDTTKRKDNEANWNINEKAAARLCDPSIAKWSTYKNDNAEYVIGGPSTEMYVDSYNQSGIDTEVLGYDYQTTNTPGYVYTVDGVKQNSGWYTNDDTLELDAMYSRTTASGGWWLASPSADYNDVLCGVRCSDRGMSYGTYIYSYGVCPLVCLKSGVVLQVQ